MLMSKLNRAQVDRLSEFTANLALLFLASVIPPIFLGNLLKLYSLILGVFLATGFLITSLAILKK